MPTEPPIRTVVVGYGLAGRVFHVPLIRRQPELRLHGVVVRDPSRRAAVAADLGVIGFADLDEALADAEVDLVVIATPHDTHPDLVVRTLEAGRDCVVDKVMALDSASCDRMIAARDASGKMLSVFHNRRWDWDFLTVQEAIGGGRVGTPRLVESAVCRYAVPRTWRGDLTAAGTILHDWGAHLVDQALQLGLGPCRRLVAWLVPAPWDGVTSGGHGRIVLEFDQALVQVETSRICRIDRPRWWVVGTEGGLVQYGIDPQEDALRAGDLDAAVAPPGYEVRLRHHDEGQLIETTLETVRGSWDRYYGNICDHLVRGQPLAVTAEDGRAVSCILEAAARSSLEGRFVDGPWPSG